MTPLVSVILPIFNRRRFLPAAFEAIRAQGIASLEVIVVDDGSTDDSRAAVDELSGSLGFPVKYVYQDNQGPYGARNTGVAAATGRYIAFYDSDDIWLPHHLPTCVAALEAFTDVHWVYAAVSIVDMDSQVVVSGNAFYESGRARPFMQLRHEARGPWHVITDDAAILCQIDHGLYCGLQNSVLRREVFERLRFEAALRNEAEDQLFAIRALHAGFRLAFVDDVHVRYQIHDQNSSGPAKSLSLEKLRRVYGPLVIGFQRLMSEVTLSRRERRALRRRIGRELFWHLGYRHWLGGDRRQALEFFGRALRTWPWDLRQLKTYGLARLRGGSGPLRPDSGT